ncbi:dnaJ homolog subfamily C member 7 [Rhodamnia argentea]|uniref:DnaJ homolog subfamily C member 7 n=1 Tax=Rhodamnia argentea TaxID=178133 RepID=A0A8B8Q2G9_9MYRT|nr:dnaJ homolog subfamily C member 7 [Rhodamnia argentea]
MMELTVISPLNNSLSLSHPQRRRLTAASCAGSSSLSEVRVCTNRTCRKQGSFQTLEALSGLAPPGVAVNACGCLGRCGSGPNLALLPEGVIVSHCGTAARAARIFCDADKDVLRNLEALALRKRAESELERGNFSDAEVLLTQAIAMSPSGGIHVMYKDRSVARLGMSNYSGALEDAKEASTLAPQYTEAYLCQGDALMAMEQFDEAEKSYSTSSQIDPSIRRSRSFKDRVERLQQKLAAADIS